MEWGLGDHLLKRSQYDAVTRRQRTLVGSNQRGAFWQDVSVEEISPQHKAPIQKRSESKWQVPGGPSLFMFLLEHFLLFHHARLAFAGSERIRSSALRFPLASGLGISVHRVRLALSQ